MERSQLSREYSGRLQINSHRRRNPFRFWMWMVSLCLGGVATAWLIWNSAFGSPAIYNAGPLSAPHHMLENRCEVCHEPFSGPLERLISFGVEAQTTSAPDKKCLACHDGAGHFFSGDPNTGYHERNLQDNLVAGHEQHCAECHREHDGEQDLRRVASSFCIGCHGRLQEFAADSSKIDSLTFQNLGATRIADFAGHPEFAIHELARGDGRTFNVPQSHAAHLVVESFQREGENQTRWQDRAVIRFNHSKHLKPKDARGLQDARGEFHDLSNDCSSCHQPDAERRDMEPVNYAQHCRSCHPLVFDAERVREKGGSLFTIDWGNGLPDAGRLRSLQNPSDVRDISELKGKDSSFELLVVPHRSPQEVRGFLTDVYALSLLQQVKNSDPELKLQSDVRRRPGHPEETAKSPLISPQEIAQVDSSRSLAEALVRSPTYAKSSDDQVPNLFRSMHWLQNSGGCGFCHESNGDSMDDWIIRKPNIPDKWLLHSKFDHDPHRMLKCTECHSSSASPRDILEKNNQRPDIYNSSRTGDILIPGIATCKSCHTTEQAVSRHPESARSDCLECHVYHKRDFETPGKRELGEFLGITPKSKSEQP